MKIKKYPLFLPEFSSLNYDLASDLIIEKAIKRESYGVTALAVHGLITSLTNESLGRVINEIDLIVPDGQPIKWALNSFYKLRLKDRVTGPTLTSFVLQKAGKKNLKVYLYGSTETTIKKFKSKIATSFPSVEICGIHPDRFRDATESEDAEDIQKINTSGANIILVGRGCPRQEFWVASHKGKINGVMIAIGAAFDFHAGNLRRAPNWMQKLGLEWLFRLGMEPRRLWKRYLVTNFLFIYKFITHKFIKKRPI